VLACITSRTHLILNYGNNQYQFACTHSSEYIKPLTTKYKHQSTTYTVLKHQRPKFTDSAIRRRHHRHCIKTGFIKNSQSQRHTHRFRANLGAKYQPNQQFQILSVNGVNDDDQCLESNTKDLEQTELSAKTECRVQNRNETDKPF
jgi:hypothetical protein